MPANNATERFCNRTAAEFLVPEEELRAYWPTVQNQKNPFQKIALKFKVSAIVAARRLFDLELIERDTFFDFYEKNKEQGKRRPTTKSSGNFWNTQRWRIGPRFASAVVTGGQRRAPLVSGSLQPHWSETKHLRKNAGRDGNSAFDQSGNTTIRLGCQCTHRRAPQLLPYSISVLGFWDSLIRHFRGGSLLSIDKVRDELPDVSKREDEEPDALYYWTKDSPRDLFVSSGEQAGGGHLQRRNRLGAMSSPQFYRGAKDEFARKADGWLVAYTQVLDVILVTQEVWKPDSQEKSPYT